MEATLKMFAFLLLCCLCSGENAYEQCKLSDLAVTQTVMPGHVAGGYPVYAVAVENRCICSQGDVKLACRGFNSSAQVDPAGVLRLDGDGLCTLNGGYYIGMGPNYAVRFHYAWRSQLSFKPVSSTIACSAAPEPSWR